MTENNVAAQAGDEPMPVAWAVFASNGNVRIWFGDKAAADRWKAANELAGELVQLGVVSPRATADVERDKGLEAAAALIDRKVNVYDDEMGSTDRETGTREYPGDGCEWVNEMGELAEEIRALKSVATTKPGA